MSVTIRAAAIALCLSALAISTYGQPRVDPRNMYERVLAIVPIVGKGTMSDPKRPMYAPALQATSPTSRTGILAFTYVQSDDGKFALVEFVAQDRNAYKSILADATVKTFFKGRDTPESIETEFKIYKKDFDLKKFGGVTVP